MKAPAQPEVANYKRRGYLRVSVISWIFFLVGIFWIGIDSFGDWICAVIVGVTAALTLDRWWHYRCLLQKLEKRDKTELG